MLNVALPLSAHPIHFWEAPRQKGKPVATTQRPIRRVLTTIQTCSAVDHQTSEKLIVSQKSSSRELPPTTDEFSPLLVSLQPRIEPLVGRKRSIGAGVAAPLQLPPWPLQRRPGATGCRGDATLMSLLGFRTPPQQARTQKQILRSRAARHGSERPGRCFGGEAGSSRRADR